MKVELWTFGKSKTSWVQAGRDEYLKRLTAVPTFSYTELYGFRVPKKATAAVVQSVEADYVLGKLQPSDKLYLFDEQGKTFTSRAFAAWYERLQHQGGSRVVLLIGGAYGFDDRLYARAQGKIRLSDMTLSHQLVRVVALEQLYRAHAILTNHPYHND